MEGLKSIMELSMQCLPKVRDEVYAEWQFYQCYKLLYTTMMLKNAALKLSVHVENKHQNDRHPLTIDARYFGQLKTRQDVDVLPPHV